ncbi:hypothetical protein, partial [Klebsiella pneumoniae]|uniref:hypothetical protein n=1 Tax=Klebsiella pneumoniae TaxID=573 RepID=UPI0035290191
MGSCAAPSAKGDDKFITTDYLQQCHFFPHAGLNKPPILARLTRSLQRRNAKIENRLDDFHRFPNNECVLTHNQVIS